MSFDSASTATVLSAPIIALNIAQFRMDQCLLDFVNATDKYISFHFQNTTITVPVVSIINVPGLAIHKTHITFTKSVRNKNQRHTCKFAVNTESITPRLSNVMTKLVST